MRREVAANLTTTADVLELLARDRDWRTRAAVAARRDAPAAAHRLLIDDRAWQVVYTLGDNPSVDIEVWRIVAAQGSKDLRAYLAGQPFVPLEIARLLLDTSETDVRRALASQTPHREMLDVLLSDPHPGVRCDALSNNLVTHADVDRAVHDRDHLVRAFAASHLPVRNVDLDRLLQDRAEFVRSEAADRQAGGSTPGPDGRLRDPFAESDAVALVEGEPPSGLGSPYEVAHWPATPRKPTMKWFKLFSQYHPATDEIPGYVAKLWKVAGRVDRDLAWVAWWEPAPYRVLDLSFGSFGPPGNRPTMDGNTLYASISDHVSDEAKAALQALTADDADQFFCGWTHQQLEVTLESVARDLGLSIPPALPTLR